MFRDFLELFSCYAGHAQRWKSNPVDTARPFSSYHEVDSYSLKASPDLGFPVTLSHSDQSILISLNAVNWRNLGPLVSPTKIRSVVISDTR